MSVPVEMIKTIAAMEIPNGTVGQAEDGIKTEAGLHYAVFENGDEIHQAYVYRHEVKLLDS